MKKRNNLYTIEEVINTNKIKIGITLTIFTLLICLFILLISKSRDIQNLIISFGESLKGRSLNSEKWHERLSLLGFRNCLITFSLATTTFGLIILYSYKQIIEESTILQKIVLFCTAILSGLFVLLILDSGNGWGGDFSEYIAQARAIVTGTIDEQVKNNSYIIANSPPMLGDAVYPWGFPLLMSPFYAIFGHNIFALKIPVMICFAFTVLFCNFLFRRHFSIFQAEIATLFIAFNPVLIFFCNSSLSDIPFLCFSIITVYFCEKLYFSDKNEQLCSGICTGLFAFLAFMTRSNGIVFPCLFLTLHFIMLIYRNGKIREVMNKLGFAEFSNPNILAHVLPYLIFVALLLFQNLILPKAGTTHSNYLHFISLKSIIRNCKYYFYIFKDYFPFGASFFFAWLIPFFCYGLIKYFLRKPVLSIYSLGVMGILILWPGTQGIRFCFPVIPTMIIFTGLGIKDFMILINNCKISKDAILFEFLVIVLYMALYAKTSLYINNEYGAYSKDAKELYAVIKEKTTEDDKIIFFKPRVLYLETGRLGFRTHDINRLSDADYLVLSKDGYRTFNYEIENQYPEKTQKLKKIFENESLKCYKILQVE